MIEKSYQMNFLLETQGSAQGPESELQTQGSFKNVLRAINYSKKLLQMSLILNGLKRWPSLSVCKKYSTPNLHLSLPSYTIKWVKVLFVFSLNDFWSI